MQITTCDCTSVNDWVAGYSYTKLTPISLSAVGLRDRLSLAAAEPNKGHKSNISCPPDKASIALCGAEGPDALQVPIKALMVAIDLEGCGPLQPGTNKGPILGAYFPDQSKFPSISAAPRDRAPSRFRSKH